jgi:hypothetical protein
MKVQRGDGYRGSVMARKVVSADGTHWSVGRRWLPRRPRWRGKKRKKEKESGGGFDDLFVVDLLDLDVPVISGVLAAVAIAVAVVALVVLAVTFVFPAVILLIEVVLLALIAGVGLAARILFRRPWTVEAMNTRTGELHVWNVVGWRSSSGLIGRVADALTRGDSPQTAAGP